MRYNVSLNPLGAPITTRVDTWTDTLRRKSSYHNMYERVQFTVFSKKVNHFQPTCMPSYSISGTHSKAKLFIIKHAEMTWLVITTSENISECRSDACNTHREAHAKAKLGENGSWKIEYCIVIFLVDMIIQTAFYTFFRFCWSFVNAKIKTI